jgi:excisionase family DNA binding protein
VSRYKTIPPEKPVGLTRTQTAQRLGCHERSVDRLIREGRLKVYRIGVRVLVTTVSIERFVAGETAA